MLLPTGAPTTAGSTIGKALLVIGVLGLGSVLIRGTSTSLPSVARVAWSALVSELVIHGFSAFMGEQWMLSVTGLGSLRCCI